MTNKIESFRGEYSYMSNFSSHPITYNGLEYPTVEHAYQSLKCQNQYGAEMIRLLKTPTEAKKAGKKNKN